MDIIKAIYSHRAIREFDATPVDQSVLRQLIDAAIQAPSAVNPQPWSFCVVRDKTLLDRISYEAKAHMLRASLAGLMSYLLSDPNFDIFYHAPALIVISAVAESPWAVEDCSLAAENLMLAACAAGLGTCWIGFAQPWLGSPSGYVGSAHEGSCSRLGPRNAPRRAIVVRGRCLATEMSAIRGRHLIAENRCTFVGLSNFAADRWEVFSGQGLPPEQ
jgi:hypothetical protein